MSQRSPLARLLVLLGLFTSAAALTHCAPPEAQAPNPLRYSEDAKKAYDRALESFLDRDWEEAKVLMQEVRRKYAYSRYARLAELRLADIDFEQEKFASAITAYRSFSHDHRTDESLPYARFRICKGLYQQISDTVLLPPQEERDQASAADAYRELNAFLLDFPQTKWSKEAKYMLVMVTSRLVRHELYVARYYIRKDNFEAASNRILFALRQFDGSGLEPEALLLLAETYAKRKKMDQARALLQQIIDTYRASPFLEPATKLLAQLGGPSSSPPSPAVPASAPAPAPHTPPAPPPLF
jgi:outer membrane protein assembly factor BamD